MSIISKLFGKFGGKKNAAIEAKEMRENLSHKQIDKTIDDSFPASDPPSSY